MRRKLRRRHVRQGPLGRAVGDEIAHKFNALIILVHRYELVGLMGLVDGTGTTNDGGDFFGLEVTCFGAVADNIGGIVTRQAAHEGFGSAVFFGAQAGDAEFWG